MKLFISSFLIVFVSFLNAQKIDSLDLDGDGILNSDDMCPTIKGVKQFHGCPDPKPDCTNFQIEKKILYDKFKKEAININYSDLSKMISAKIIYKKLNKNNIILSPINAKGYDCGVPFMFECSSDYNVINPNYSADDYLTAITIEDFKTKLKANIIPCMSINNFENEWGLNLYESTYKTYFSDFNLDKFDDLILKESSISKVNNKNKEVNVFYFKYKNEKLDISNANYLMMDFKNELDNIVIIDLYYNKEAIPQTLKFQYKENRWQQL